MRVFLVKMVWKWIKKYPYAKSINLDLSEMIVKVNKSIQDIEDRLDTITAIQIKDYILNKTSNSTERLTFISYFKEVLFFSTLTDGEKDKFLNYELTVYFCHGTDKEKLDWFRVINIAGERLLNQELLNAVYVGTFVSDARRHFSKNRCPAYKIGSDYMSGNPIEQAYLETVLKWASRKDRMLIDEYMARHQHDPNANKLWAYYSQIITWMRSTFVKYRKEMKGLDWGELYDE
ncbi:MAG: hypothetical protein RR137_04055, partial [Odoribacter sp.]